MAPFGWTGAGSIFEFDSFPFITGITRDGGVSTNRAHPLRLTLDLEKGCISQVVDPGLRKILEDSYREGSMLSTPLGESEANKALAQEIVSIIEDACGGLAGKSFAEPGCGTGYLLRALLDQGASEVAGFEPGGQAEEGSKRYGVPIRRCFFHAGVSTELYDCVYHYGVLEHIEDARGFLCGCLARLKVGGQLIALVPGCDEDMNLGNISILAHEHINYFTRDSLAGIFEALALADVQVRPLVFSKGILCVTGRKREGGVLSAHGCSWLDLERERFLDYANRLESTLALLLDRAARMEIKGETLGLY